MQTIIPSNVSTRAGLDDLLGGLLLSASGNLTGTLQNVSEELPTLGFSQNVLNALANRTLPNVGAWGAPTSTYTPPAPPEPWCDEVANGIVNAVSGEDGSPDTGSRCSRSVGPPCESVAWPGSNTLFRV